MNTTVPAFAARMADAAPMRTLFEYATGSASISVAITPTPTAPPAPQHAQGGSISLPDHFRVIANWWHEATDFLSALPDKVNHPAYLYVMGMGREAIPLVLADLERTGGYWYTALRHLAADFDDLPVRQATSRETREAWLAWGVRHGFRDAA